MKYRLELRHYGVAINQYETDERKKAKEKTLEWLHTTSEAAVVLILDGKDVPMGEIPKLLGFRNQECFDDYKRYSRCPYSERHNHHIRPRRRGE